MLTKGRIACHVVIEDRIVDLLSAYTAADTLNAFSWPDNPKIFLFFVRNLNPI